MEYEIKAQEKFNIGLKELWDYKELFFFFTWRDIKVKYKQTIFGFLWAILQPLFMTFIFTFFLGESISQKSNLNIPYVLFALSGMLLWTIFSGGLSNAANSMVNNANIIKKIYFPRLIIPISAILCSIVDFFVAFVIFIVLLLFYSVDINPLGILYVPIAVLMTCLASMGCGTLLAALNVKYRDVRYAIPFLIQALLFLTPVLYPISISQNIVAQWLLRLNPVSGALELMRSLFGNYTMDMQTVVLSSFSTIVLFVIGIVYFRKTEHYFADLA